MSDPIKLTCLTCGQTNRLPADRLGAGPKCAVCGAALVNARVTAIDPAAHDKATRGDSMPIVIDYWAPWCGPCRMMAPEFAKAAAATPAVRFAKINTEDHPAIARRLGIRGIPLLILWKQGREVARLAGARPATEIATFARQHTGSR